MKPTFLFFVLLFFSFNSFSQSSPKNSLYLELGGAAGLYSFNYERMIRDGSKVDINARLGFGVIPYRNRRLGVDWNIKNIGFSAPIGINFVFGNKNGHFETGLGCTFTKLGWILPARVVEPEGLFSDELVIHKEFDHYFSPKIGYRYQKPDGGFLFKASVTPLILIYSSDDHFNDDFYPFLLGFSLGKAF